MDNLTEQGAADAASTADTAADEQIAGETGTGEQGAEVGPAGTEPATTATKSTKAKKAAKANTKASDEDDEPATHTLMLFPRRLRVMLDQVNTITFEAGLQHVPVEVKDHWYLKANGVKPANEVAGKAEVVTDITAPAEGRAVPSVEVAEAAHAAANLLQLRQEEAAKNRAAAETGSIKK